MICEEFGIGICVTYSPVQRSNRGSFAQSAQFAQSWTRAERSASKRKEGPGRRKEENEEEKKEEGEEDEGFVEKAFRVGVARWASRLPRRECG